MTEHVTFWQYVWDYFWDYFREAVTFVILALIVTCGLLACGMFFLVVEVPKYLLNGEPEAPGL